MLPRWAAGPEVPLHRADEQLALEWLYGFADFERGVGWNPRAAPEEQWLLGRTRALLDLLGGPDNQLRCVLVAGTKGKGSTAAFLASILAAADVRAGLYTQPHLQRFRERFRVDGAMLGPAAFAASVARLRAVVPRFQERYPEAGEPTTFELSTALAIDSFARFGCSIAVLEVGLGGRLDATNAVEPSLSIITPISRDHTTILGNTLGAIAREKAGILRRGVPAVLAPQRPSAARALAQACRRAGARCQTATDDGRTFLRYVYGRHQAQNAAVAARAASLLVNVSDDVIQQGVSQLHWPGRFEVVPGNPVMVLDGAHNDASAAALAETLGPYAAGRPIHLVLGMFRDKDAGAILRPLLPLAASAAATTAPGPRAVPAAVLAAICRARGFRSATGEPEPGRALEAARQKAVRDGGIVCVTGSLALVGAARDGLGLPPAERLWQVAERSGSEPVQRGRLHPR